MFFLTGNIQKIASIWHWTLVKYVNSDHLVCVYLYLLVLAREEQFSFLFDCHNRPDLDGNKKRVLLCFDLTMNDPFLLHLQIKVKTQ